MEKKTIGKFISALRRAHGMTQKELGEKLYVSDKTVSRWERDEGAPDLTLIPVIAEIFGVTCDELLRGERRSPEERRPQTNNPENADRWKEAHWEVSQEKGTSNSIYEALLQIYVDDRIGMLADVTAVLAEMRVSILQINVTNRNDGSAIINLKVGCRNIDHINSIVSRLRGLSGVDNILRGFA